MVQHWALFNLTAGKGITPRSLGAHSNLPHLVTDRTLPCALLYLLAEVDHWNGARLVIAGDAMKKGDLPEAKDHAKVKDTELMKALSEASDKRLIQQGWLARKILQEKDLALYPKLTEWAKHPTRNTEYRRTIIDPRWVANPATPPLDRPDVLIVNLDRGEHLDPTAFGGTGSLFDAAFHGHNAGVGSALVLMLAAGNRGGEGDLPVDSAAIGFWAGDRIAVVNRTDVPAGSVDVSADAKDALDVNGIHRTVQAPAKAPVTRRRSARVLPKRKPVAFI